LDKEAAEALFMDHNVSMGSDCGSEQSQVWGCGKALAFMAAAGILGYFVSGMVKS